MWLKIAGTRKMSKKKMNKGEVVAARADGSVIMQWQKGEKKCHSLMFL